MKVKKGTSFFLKVNNSYAFCIALASKSDEDGLTKVLRSPFAPTKALSLASPLNEIILIDLESETTEEWDMDSVRKLSRDALLASARNTTHYSTTELSAPPKKVDTDNPPVISNDIDIDNVLNDLIP